MLAGTISKWVGNGSRPKPRATSHTSCIACSMCLVISVDMRYLCVSVSCRHRRLLDEELLERGVHVLFALDRDADKLRRLDFVQRGHQAAGGPAAIDLFLDLAIPEQIAALE